MYNKNQLFQVFFKNSQVFQIAPIKGVSGQRSILNSVFIMG